MPDNRDNSLILLSKVIEISERLSSIETKIDTIEADVSYIKQEDRKQNELLDEHIQGTVTNRQRLEEEIKVRRMLESRVKSLEKYPTFLSVFKKWITYLAAVGAAVATVAALVKKLFF